MSTQGETQPLLKAKTPNDGNGSSGMTKEETYRWIVKQPIVWKFCGYGFLKNLKFFDPYFLIILMSPPVNWNLADIGFLISIRVAVQYCCEIPTGMIADRYGRKYVLQSCFIFYICSFVSYFLGVRFNVGLIYLGGMFFGLGEATRSGVHKTIILAWLDRKGLKDFKTFTSGRTRSFSMLGSALSSIIAILLMIYIPMQYISIIFLFSAVPYVLDFLLVGSYPSYLNEKNHQSDKTLSMCASFAKQSKALFKHIVEKDVRKCIISNALLTSLYISLRDYIQPIMMGLMKDLIVQAGYTNITKAEEELWLKILMGSLYCVYNLSAAIGAKKTYLITDHIEAKTAIDYIFYIWALNFVLIGICIYFQFPWPILFLFGIIFLINSMLNPLIVTCYGDVAHKSHKTAVLSVAMFFQSGFLFILAPLFGWVGDHGIDILFFILAPMLVMIELFGLSGNYTKLEDKKKPTHVNMESIQSSSPHPC